jgi:bile acid-coenzyme A ligase
MGRPPVPAIGTQISRLAAEAPEAPAVTHAGRTVTRGELESATNRLARAYADLGVRQGDYVTIALPNSIEWVKAVVATWKLGAIPQPLSSRLPDAEYARLLDLRERALLVGRPDPRGVVGSVDGDFDPGAGVSDAPLPEMISPSLKSMASGGSTGRPKLIEAGGNGRYNGAAVAAMMGNSPDDTQLVSVPLSHNTGFTSATTALATGQHLVLMSRFDPGEFLRLIGQYRVNYVATVPTIMQRLLPVYRAGPPDPPGRSTPARRGAYDLSSLRRWWHLAAPCPPNVKEAWIEILGPEKVWELYGGTELQALTFISGTEWLAHRGSVGRVVSGEMKVLDDNGDECAPGQVGEIYMRPSPGSRPTYRYIGSTARNRDGWDSLGDLGWFDSDGYLYLADRRVDMFTVGGRNVYPAEVENALAEHHAVLSCLVVGVPHNDLGQVPHALVHADPAAALDEAAVKAFVAQRLSEYKVPRSVEFVDTPLRDDAGKARRAAVRDEVIARLPAPGSQ